MTSRNTVSNLEIEGVRYIGMNRGPAAYVLGPSPARGGDLELEGGVVYDLCIRVPRLPRVCVCKAWYFLFSFYYRS